ncbi:multidrug efflux SMR transporter [Helicobacter sp. MIT 21-1697]|uniref:DMT family transporter n=1 Tax=Helicobacter sp. MIT 21-1697 TaxID=2993733 RepID=UPI00224B02A4|nr:multidrug efflux SMR transporter [Helicobacter sp. MIT 21-1697]MCX2717930.1 multidrug efflux SMR transporter [Helicobacter sp. MIT 21-1697]
MKKFKLTQNLAWGLVLLGGIIECFWASGLKYADSLFLYALTGIGIFASLICGILAIKVLEVGIAYSVFAGIGTAGITLAEILVFGEEFSALKVLFITTLLIGVVGLKLSADKTEEAQEEKLAQEISHDLGLDEIVQDSCVDSNAESSSTRGRK